MPQSVCLSTVLAVSLPSAPTVSSNAIGPELPARVSSPCTLILLPSAAGCTAVERNAMPWRCKTSSSIVCSMLALSSSPSACIPPVPSRTRSDEASASNVTLACPSPTSSVACQEVTSIRRSCPAIAAAPVRPVRTASVLFSGPNACVPSGIGMREII